MSFGTAIFLLLLLQERTNVYQQPSYFVPIFGVLWLIGLVLCIGAVRFGFTSKLLGKGRNWLRLGSFFLMLYFLQWFLLVFAIVKQSMSLLWGLLSFFHLPIVLAVGCLFLTFLKLKAESVETTNSEES